MDVEIKDIQETIKIGDKLRINRNENIGITTAQARDRIVKEILSADIVETDMYTGKGIDKIDEKPVRWEKQKIDVVLNGDIISKTRPVLEPQIYPTAKIISDLSTTDGPGTLTGDGIFVDDSFPFLYEKERYNITGDKQVDALISSGQGEVSVAAAATAIVASNGTICSIVMTETGERILSTPTVKIAAPHEVGIGIGTTATATANISSTNFGSVQSITITNSGFGYTHSAPPGVIIELPTFDTEKITTISNVEGYTGIITGISPVTTSGQKGIKFMFRAVKPDNNGKLENETVTKLKVGYPILVTETSVGTGVTSVNGHNNSVVGIGTQFLDNIYIVRSISNKNSNDGEIVCDIKNNSNTSGITSTGFYNGVQGQSIPLGLINWGRLYGNDLNRSSNPISIGVTGLTVDVGLTTFPTIQRKNYVITSVRGVRSSGSIRAFGL